MVPFQSPAEKTTGDLVLSAFCSDGTQHLLLGDFTGHGLPAAIGGPIVADIFYTMTRKNLPMPEIVSEINERLYEKTPAEVFLAAGFLALDPSRSQLTVWNCGIPDILVFRRGICQQRVSSTLFARGVVSCPDDPGVSLDVEPGDRVFACSDGLVEEHNAVGTLFGQENLERLIILMLATNEPMEWIQKRVGHYRANHAQTDDMTMVEMIC